MNILIAGASGYIGRALIPKLRAKYPHAKITALSRSNRKNEDPMVEWKACDLFSLKNLEAASPEEVDVAYYLVHSMSPTAHLDQGTFADYDLILADNFARHMKKKKGVQVIYLGGLIPQNTSLSPHLKSRLEVEEVFSDSKIPFTTFRAGLIIGPHGSSFEILLRLVKKLPVLVGPKWTQTKTTPVDLNTVVEALAETALNKETQGKTYDLAGCLPLSYIEMMGETAKWLGLKRFFIPVPFLSPTLSRWWVTLVTRMPKALVYPLIESLRHSMLARPNHLYGQPPQKTYAEMLRTMSPTAHEKSKPVDYVPQKLQVRSVQRLPLPSHMNAKSVKEEYARWLLTFSKPFMLIWMDKDRVVFSFIKKRWELLALNLSSERSSSDRQLLYIVGGLLAGKDQKGRLEFREVLGRRYVLAAIHQFRPAIPWYIYKYSQALIHLAVMKAFAWHLKKKCPTPGKIRT